MTETSEKYEQQVGVLLPTGQVQLLANRHAAEDRVRAINAGLIQSGLPDRARVVTSRAHVVTKVTRTPWTAIQ